MTKESIANSVQLVFLDFIESILMFSILVILGIRLVAGPFTSITIADDTLYDESSNYIVQSQILDTAEILQLNMDE